MAEDQAFSSTQWSALARLHDGKPDSGWDWFIRRYRGYVGALLRHLGLRHADVETATEDFWGYLYRSRAVERADRHGRFRSFLSGVVRNYARSWQREVAPRHTSAGASFDLEALPDVHDDADLELWAAQVLHLALARLSREHPDDARALRWFYGLPDEVGQEAPPRVRATEIARRLGGTANAMHQTLYRGRQRLRACFELEVSTTVGSSPELRDELRQLLVAVDRTRPGLVPTPEECS